MKGPSARFSTAFIRRAPPHLTGVHVAGWSMVKPQTLLPVLRRSRLHGHAFALASIGLALAIRFLADSVLPSGYPFLTFFPAVIVTTFLAGLWPGIVAALLGAAAAWFFFIPPPGFALDASSSLAMGFYAFIVAVDIAVIHVMNTALERLDVEQRRSAALARQTELMFSELQHRVSNNLQLVSSLLMMQQAKVVDPAALQSLDEARARVATLGRLHRALHNPARQGLDIGRYLDELCRDLQDAAGATEIAWEIKADPVEIAIDKLVPVALIVAELFSNALEHAFAGNRPGTVTIALHRDGGEMRLVVRDNGPGLPADFDLETQNSLGLGIVRALASQIGGRIAMHSDGGTVATLTFQP